MDFAEFYQATSPRTLRYAYGLTGDLAQAQDVVQEAYIRAWQRWRRLSGYDDAEAWLRLVVSRLVFDWWRHLRVRRNAPVEQPGSTPPPSEDTILVVAALKKLPERQRQALALHYLLDVSVAEIAAELGVSEGTVKSWLSRGRDNLATVLKAELAQVPVRSAADVAELGRRRRRTTVAATVTAASLVVIAVIVLTTAVLGRNRTMPPTPTVNPTGSPTVFSPLRRVGSMPLTGLAFPEVAIVNGRAYAVDTGDPGVRITAMDLATGKPAWPAIVQPPRGARESVQDWIQVTPDALLVITQRDVDGGAHQATAYMYDPATGRQRWSADEFGVPDDVLLFPSVLVVPDRIRGKIQGLDVHTGAVAWQLDVPAQRLFGMRSPGDLARSDLGVGVPEMGNGGDKLYLTVVGGNTITEYAAATGVPTGRVWTGIPPNDGYLAYNGSIYIRSARELYRLHLDDGKLTRLFSGGGVMEMSPCYLDDVCLIDATESGGRNLVALHDDHPKWTVSVPDAARLDPVGLTLRVAPNGDGPVVVFDSDGREVLRTASGRVLRLDAGNFLVCEWTSDRSVRLSGVPVGTLRQQALGSLSTVPGQLAADGTALVAVVNGELVLYSLA